jgi:long-chain acyl-CoA synthetase
MKTFPRRLLHDDLLANSALPDIAAKTAVIANGGEYTYAELHQASQRLATALGRLGVRPGDRVAIYMENDWPCVVSIYATLIAGAVLVLVNPQTKPEKLEFLIRDSGAVVLLADSSLTQSLGRQLSRLEQLSGIIRAGAAEDELQSASFEAITGKNGDTVRLDPPVITLDLAALIYTSGSTGRPKGVMQTHQSMLFAIGSITEYLRLSVTDRILCISPLAFDYGLYQLLMSVALGATLVLERSFALPASVFERTRLHAVTVFPGVPTAFALLLAVHRRSPLCFPTVTRVTNTAAALPEEFIGSLREIFPNALIYRMYGLTECKRVSYLEPELIASKPGSVGKAIPGTEVFLLSADGTPTRVGEIGVLHVRGPHVMLGYWNRPDLSEEMLKPMGLPGQRVLCTQDLFRMDAEGFLYFVSRSDEIIKTRGEKVSPVEVENALYRIPGIREVAVVGIPDAVLGEAIRAYVVPNCGAALTAARIRAECSKYLETFMVPQQIELCDHLPRTESGKVSKSLLLQKCGS